MTVRRTGGARRGAVLQARLIVVALLGSVLVVLPMAEPAAALGPSSRVSTDGLGAEATGPSHTPALSADGRYVAFISNASFVPADTNGFADVYRKDRATGAVDLVSLTDAEGLGDAPSSGEELAMSDDGTKVAFRSSAENLDPTDGNGQKDLFVRDLVAGTTKRVNVDNAGTLAGLGPDFFSMSADGNKIAFISYTSLNGGGSGVYVRDVAAAVTTFIHIADGAQLAISGDGTKVAFGWSAPNSYEIYLHDDFDTTLYRINYGTSSSFADYAGLIGPDAMSYDGNIISFWSDGDAYGPLVAKPRAVYAYDHVARKAGGFGMQRVSELPNGTDGNQDSGGTTNDWPKGAVSADGTKVAFTSQATNLSPAAPNGAAFVKNRISGTITPASLATDATARGVANTTLSSDGTAVAFATGASDVVPGDTNAASDVFVSAETGPAPPVVFGHIAFTRGDDIWVMSDDGNLPTNLTSRPGLDTDPTVSPDGTKIAFVSDRAAGNPQDIWVMNIDGTNAYNATATVDGQSADPAWSPDGTKLAFANVGPGTGSYDVRTINADGSGAATNLTVGLGPNSADGFPTWSPDGTRIAFNRDPVSSGNNDIWSIAATDGSGGVNLTGDPVGQQFHASWSPAGIAFVSTRDAGASEIYTMAADGSGQARMTFSGATDSPDWSPDGTALAYSSSGNLVTMVVGQAGETPVTNGLGATSPDWYTDLSLTVSARTVLASPNAVAFSNIPVQQNSPATKAAVETGGLQIVPSLVPLQITPGLVPLQITPGLVGLQITPGLVPLQIVASLVPLQIMPSLVGLQIVPALVPLQIVSSLVPLQITPALVPAVVDRLKATPFSALTFNAPASAPAVLFESPLEKLPYQQFSVYDALMDSKAGPRLRALPLNQVNLSAAFGDVGVGTLLLGNTKFADMNSPAINVCATLEGLGYGRPNECGGAAFAAPGDTRNGLSARPLDLALAGVPFNDPNFPLNLHLVKMGEINLDPAAELLNFNMANAALLQGTNLGSIKVADLPTATLNNQNVIDCSAGRCVGETTLYQAMLAGTLKPGFQFRHLGSAVAPFSLGEVVYGLLGATSVPYGDFTTAQLGVLGLQDGTANTHHVTYTARHTVPAGSSGPLTVKLDLPPTFVPLANAGLSINGGPAVAPIVTTSPTANSFTWTVNAAPGAALVATVPVAPGVYTGEQRADLTITSANRRLALTNTAPVEVVENNEPNDTPATATPMAINTLYIGHAAGVDYYSLTVPPDELVDLTLNNRESGDNDIVVYHPTNAAGVRPEDRLVAATSNETTPMPLSETPGGNRYGEPVAGGTAQDIPLLDRPVAAIGDTWGRANEHVQFRSLFVPGQANSTYLVQVSSYLSQSSSGPYTLFGTSRPAPRPALTCSARTGVDSLNPRASNARALPTLTAATKTLFLVNQDRLNEQYGEPATTAFLARVDALAANAKVNGKVVPLDANLNYRQKMAAWDAVPCDPLLANAVLRAGHDVIDSLIAGSGGADVRYVELLGSSDVIPKGFGPDATQRGNESQFQAELASLFTTNNSLVGSGQNIGSDDAWGAIEARAYGPRFVYPPVRAVGRLSETLAEMTKPIDTFLESGVNGSLARSTASTFGGYFMKDLAQAIDEVVGRVMATNSHSLDATDNWTSASLRSTLNPTAPATVPDITSFNTHANPFGAAAPGDPATPYRAAELDAAGAKLKAKVLLTIGCHTATGVPDVLLTGATDFAQATSRNGGILLGQTGYGLGLDGSLAFSERLMSYVAEEITRQKTIGDAFVVAKQRYLAGGLMSPYDEKALAELSLNGLAMFDFGPNATTPAPPSSQVSSTTTDPASGLQTASITISPQLREVTTPLGKYFETPTSPTPGLGATSAAPERPVVARVDIDVTQPNKVARAAWTTARTYAPVMNGVDAVFGAASMSGATATPSEPQPSDVVYPVNQLSVNGYQPVTGPVTGPKRQQLTLLPQQFTSTGKVNGKTVGGLRNTTSETISVFYGPTVLTDATPPAITDVAALKANGKVRFIMRANDPESNVVRASALFEDTAGTHYAELTKIGGEWTAEVPFAGTEVRVEFRALNGQALIGRAVDKSFGFLAVTQPDDGVIATIIGTQTNGYYDASARVELAGRGRSFEYRLNNDPWRSYTAPVPVGFSGTNRLTYRTSAGESGVVVVPVKTDITGPDITITSPTDGAAIKPGTVVTLAFSCTDTTSSATCKADIPEANRQGLTTGQTFVMPVGETHVIVTAVDGYGNQTVGTITIQGLFGFEGFLSPVQNGVINKANAGRTIPLKWRLYNAAGEVKTLDVVRVIDSKQIACDPSLLVVTIPDLVVLPRDGLSYAGDHYEYGWKTQTAWAGQCRNFRIQLSDGSSQIAQFKFT